MNFTFVLIDDNTSNTFLTGISEDECNILTSSCVSNAMEFKTVASAQEFKDEHELFTFDIELAQEY